MKKNQKEQALFSEIVTLIQYVNTWKKLALFVLLTFFSFCIYISYENRQSIAYWLMSQTGNPEINFEKIIDQKNDLLQVTTANAFIVFKINLQANQRQVLYIFIHHHEIHSLEHMGDLALRAGTQQSNNLINLINNDTYCYALDDNDKFNHYLISDNIHYLCSTKIPPRSGFFIGVISLGFNHKPNNEDYIRQKILLAAEKLIT